MSQEIRRSRIDNAVTRCDNHTSTRPTPCLLRRQQGDRGGGRRPSLNQYLTDQEDRKLAQVARALRSDRCRGGGSGTILFAKRMGYHKIGIATCGPFRGEPDLGQRCSGPMVFEVFRRGVQNRGDF